MNDMTLSEFCDVTKATKNGRNWEVSFTVVGGVVATLFVAECISEFEAKERAYLYLKDRIENKW